MTRARHHHDLRLPRRGLFSSDSGQSDCFLFGKFGVTSRRLPGNLCRPRAGAALQAINMQVSSRLLLRHNNHKHLLHIALQARHPSQETYAILEYPIHLYTMRLALKYDLHADHNPLSRSNQDKLSPQPRAPKAYHLDKDASLDYCEPRTRQVNSLSFIPSAQIHKRSSQ